MRYQRLVVVAALAACACAHDPVGRVRFRDEEPVLRVDDRRPIPEPEAYDETLTPYYLDIFFVRRFTRWTELHDTKRAQNTNSMDEVPDSTWFVNRIGAREVSPDEVLRGPGAACAPEEHKPWAVKSLKVGGKSLGFIVEDANGHRFLLKFDAKGFPELETAADVIGQRIFWALGFNVPNDQVVYFTRQDLVLAQGARKRDPLGRDKPLADNDIEDALAKIPMQADGTYRGQVSSFLPGKILGGFKPEGLRSDDANDRVPHQHRRELRATQLFYAWLGDIDTKQSNTVDTWEEDPVDPFVRYVKHYFVDFGKSLTTWRDEMRLPYDGWATAADLGEIVWSFFTLGFGDRPWERMVYPHIRGVGWFEAEQFDPDRFVTAYPYYPHALMDATDAFWGAKLIMRFTPLQIRAAVDAGRYSDLTATDYVTETLIARQRKIGLTWFRRVTPLDGIRLSADGSQLCFDDLLVRYEMAHEGAAYRARAFDGEGKATGWSSEARRDTRSEVVCIRDLALSPSGYTIIELSVKRLDPRDGDGLKPILVHLAGTRTDDAHIIGLRRENE